MANRAMVGALAATGVVLGALASVVHGRAVPVDIAAAGATTGLASYLSLTPDPKKPLSGSATGGALRLPDPGGFKKTVANMWHRSHGRTRPKRSLTD
jgi:hypothetical protein